MAKQLETGWAQQTGNQQGDNVCVVVQPTHYWTPGFMNCSGPRFHVDGTREGGGCPLTPWLPLLQLIPTATVSRLCVALCTYKLF